MSSSPRCHGRRPVSGIESAKGSSWSTPARRVAASSAHDGPVGRIGGSEVDTRDVSSTSRAGFESAGGRQGHRRAREKGKPRKRSREVVGQWRGAGRVDSGGKNGAARLERRAAVPGSNWRRPRRAPTRRPTRGLGSSPPGPAGPVLMRRGRLGNVRLAVGVVSIHITQQVGEVGHAPVSTVANAGLSEVEPQTGSSPAVA